MLNESILRGHGILLALSLAREPKRLTAGLETTTACEPQIATKSLGGQQCGQLIQKRVHIGRSIHFSFNYGVSCVNARYNILMVTIELVLLIGHFPVNHSSEKVQKQSYFEAQACLIMNADAGSTG